MDLPDQTWPKNYKWGYHPEDGLHLFEVKGGNDGRPYHRPELARFWGREPRVYGENGDTLGGAQFHPAEVRLDGSVVAPAYVNVQTYYGRPLPQALSDRLGEMYPDAEVRDVAEWSRNNPAGEGWKLAAQDWELPSGVDPNTWTPNWEEGDMDSAYPVIWTGQHLISGEPGESHWNVLNRKGYVEDDQDEPPEFTYGRVYPAGGAYEVYNGPQRMTMSGLLEQQGMWRLAARRDIPEPQNDYKIGQYVVALDNPEWGTGLVKRVQLGIPYPQIPSAYYVEWDADNYERDRSNDGWFPPRALGPAYTGAAQYRLADQMDPWEGYEIQPGTRVYDYRRPDREMAVMGLYDMRPGGHHWVIYDPNDPTADRDVQPESNLRPWTRERQAPGQLRMDAPPQPAERCPNCDVPLRDGRCWVCNTHYASDWDLLHNGLGPLARGVYYKWVWSPQEGLLIWQTKGAEGGPYHHQMVQEAWDRDLNEQDVRNGDVAGYAVPTDEGIGAAVYSPIARGRGDMSKLGLLQTIRGELRKEFGDTPVLMEGLSDPSTETPPPDRDPMSGQRAASVMWAREHIGGQEWDDYAAAGFWPEGGEPDWDERADEWDAQRPFVVSQGRVFIGPPGGFHDYIYEDNRDELSADRRHADHAIGRYFPSRDQVYWYKRPTNWTPESLAALEDQVRGMMGQRIGKGSWPEVFEGTMENEDEENEGLFAARRPWILDSSGLYVGVPGAHHEQLGEEFGVYPAEYGGDEREENQAYGALVPQPGGNYFVEMFSGDGPDDEHYGLVRDAFRQHGVPVDEYPYDADWSLLHGEDFSDWRPAAEGGHTGHRTAPKGLRGWVRGVASRLLGGGSERLSAFQVGDRVRQRGMPWIGTITENVTETQSWMPAAMAPGKGRRVWMVAWDHAPGTIGTETMTSEDKLEKVNVPEGQMALGSASGADHEGVMVAVMIPEDVAEQLEVEGGEPAKDMHVTLAYFESKAADRDDWDELEPVLEALAAKTPPMEGKIGGFGVFQNDEGDVLWAHPNVPGLAELRHEVAEACRDAGFPLSEEHGWSPHVTLKYYDGEAKKGEQPDLSSFLPIKLDKLTLMVADDPIHFELGGEGFEKEGWVYSAERVDPEDFARFKELLALDVKTADIDEEPPGSVAFVYDPKERQLFLPEGDLLGYSNYHFEILNQVMGVDSNPYGHGGYPKEYVYGFVLPDQGVYGLYPGGGDGYGDAELYTPHEDIEQALERQFGKPFEQVDATGFGHDEDTAWELPEFKEAPPAFGSDPSGFTRAKVGSAAPPEPGSVWYTWPPGGAQPSGSYEVIRVEPEAYMNTRTPGVRVLIDFMDGKPKHEAYINLLDWQKGVETNTLVPAEGGNQMRLAKFPVDLRNQPPPVGSRWTALSRGRSDLWVVTSTPLGDNVRYVDDPSIFVLIYHDGVTENGYSEEARISPADWYLYLRSGQLVPEGESVQMKLGAETRPVRQQNQEESLGRQNFVMEGLEEYPLDEYETQLLLDRGIITPMLDYATGEPVPGGYELAAQMWDDWGLIGKEATDYLDEILRRKGGGMYNEPRDWVKDPDWDPDEHYPRLGRDFGVELNERAGNPMLYRDFEPAGDTAGLQVGDVVYHLNLDGTPMLKLGPGVVKRVYIDERNSRAHIFVVWDNPEYRDEDWPTAYDERELGKVTRPQQLRLASWREKYHLREAEPGAKETCATCSAFKGGRCRMFDGAKVDADDVCDEWSDTWTPKTAAADWQIRETPGDSLRSFEDPDFYSQWAERRPFFVDRRAPVIYLGQPGEHHEDLEEHFGFTPDMAYGPGDDSFYDEDEGGEPGQEQQLDWGGLWLNGQPWSGPGADTPGVAEALEAHTGVKMPVYEPPTWDPNAWIQPEPKRIAAWGLDDIDDDVLADESLAFVHDPETGQVHFGDHHYNVLDRMHPEGWWEEGAEGYPNRYHYGWLAPKRGLYDWLYGAGGPDDEVLPQLEQEAGQPVRKPRGLWYQGSNPPPPSYDSIGEPGEQYLKFQWEPGEGLLDVWGPGGGDTPAGFADWEGDEDEGDVAVGPDFTPAHMDRRKHMGWPEVPYFEDGGAIPGIITIRPESVSVSEHARPENTADRGAMHDALADHLTKLYPGRPIFWHGAENTGNWDVDWRPGDPAAVRIATF